MKKRRIFRRKRLNKKLNMFFNSIIILLVFSIILLDNVGLRNFFKSPVNMFHMILTYQEMYRIRYALDNYHDRIGQYPDQRDFHNFLYELEAHKAIRLLTDSWGNEYVYLPHIYGDKVVLVSKGPDGIAGNRDDVRLIW